MNLFVLTRILPANSQVRLKPIALPPEHGSWGFLLEPIMLGLAVAPSFAGLFLALGVLGGFLLRQPVKIVASDLRKGKRYPRTEVALRIALCYGLIAALGMVIALWLGNLTMFVPLLLAVPLAATQLVGYITNQGRDVLPELTGACAIAASASSIALAGGSSWTVALMLWAILAIRDIPSILYVRARLRLERGAPSSRLAAWLSNGSALVAAAVLAGAGLLPVLALVAVTILTIRALLGLSPYRRKLPVKVIGMMEMGYGSLIVILTALGYRL